MCGILFAYSSSPIDKNSFEISLNSMRHRGPDAYGLQFLDNDRVGLGHRRLSIIDLSQSGNQPMPNEDESLWLVFNGEIYNYKILRQELLGLGHRFRSKADSEVLIHGYEEWGAEILNKVSGIFSFVLYDSSEKKVFAARDHLGVKPFYYYHDNNVFLVSSEPKGILKYPGLDLELDYSGFIDYFNYFYVPGPKTIWKSIKQLSAGNYLEFNIGSKPKAVKFWEIPVQEKNISMLEVKEKGWNMLLDSIQSQMVSDVPVGLFLSGGYDSATLLWQVNKISPGISTFTIGFENFERSEERQARAISEIAGSDHNEMILPENFMDDLELLFNWYDEPFAITSMMSYFKVSELASKHVKVVLAGDGGDEVFGGYNWYFNIEKYYKSRFWDKILWRFDPDKRLVDLKYQYHKAQKGGNDNFLSYRKILSRDILKFEGNDLFWSYETPGDFRFTTPLKVFQYLDFKRFITEANLIRADRSSMANSLEVRVPFLDHKLVEESASWPKNSFFSTKQKKPVLRTHLEKIYPKQILDAPKRGFGNPTKYFFQHSKELRERLQNSELFNDGILDNSLKESTLKNLSRTDLWLITVLHFWYEKWVKGK